MFLLFPSFARIGSLSPFLPPLSRSGRVDKCYVPSDALYSAATERKVRPEQISQIGLPIRRGFWGPSGSASADKDEKKGILGMVFGDREDAKPAADGDLRRRLGLIPDVPTVLIVGGGDGMGGIVEQSRAVGERLASDGSGDADGASYQMVVVCGNNAAAEQELSSTDWGAGVIVQVNGFVNNMDEYMRASDAIVTKAGPGTIAEASICGLPCVLSSYLPGQEAGNVPYVEENGFGAYEGDPAGIADTVSSWLKDTDLLAMMRAKALDAARPSATLDIARDIAALLFEHKGIKA
jgi:1,2-diacylglycerol 3-beta-galactosyltransferase